MTEVSHFCIMRPMSKTESLRVNVTPEQRAAIKAIAERDDVSEATVVRWAIRAYLQSDAEIETFDSHRED